MKPAIFLARNGILNIVPIEDEMQANPLTCAEFKVNKKAVGMLKRLKEAGFMLIVVTNQPELSDGSLRRSELNQMHALLYKAFPISDVLFCPHSDSDECPCRKPQPGLLLEATQKWHIDLNRSYLVSDKGEDAEMARAAGCTSLILKSPLAEEGMGDFTLNSLKAIEHKILGLEKKFHSRK